MSADRTIAPASQQPTMPMSPSDRGRHRRERPGAPADPGTATDRHLESARQGEETGFVALYRSLHPQLVRYLRVLVGGDAEDVASEAWIGACRDLPRFRGDVAAFRAWLLAIGRNRALDHLRAARRRPAEPVAPSELPNVGPGRRPAATADSAPGAVGTQWAIGLIASLPTEQAEAVMLRVILDLDAKTAAQILGRRPGAVRTAAHRGLKTLARKLGVET